MTATIIALAAFSSLSTLFIRQLISRHPFQIRKTQTQVLWSTCIGFAIWVISYFVVHQPSSLSGLAWQDLLRGFSVFISFLMLIFLGANIAGQFDLQRVLQQPSSGQLNFQQEATFPDNVSRSFDLLRVYNTIGDRLRAYREAITASPWTIIMFATGIVLRIAGFTAGPIWYDEMFSLQVTRQGLVEMIQSLTLNISPPGFEILLWFVTRIFGWNAFSLRLISVVASIMMLFVVYRIISVLEFSHRQKVVTLALIGMLPYQLITAQQGRVYALFALLYLVGLYSSIRGKWIWLGISITGMLWCHNISFLFIPGLLLISVVLFPKEFKQVLLIAIAAFLTFLPWVEFTVKQATTPIPWFAPLTLGTAAYNIYVSFFGWNFPSTINILAALWIAILGGGALVAMLFNLVSVTFSSGLIWRAYRQTPERKHAHPTGDMLNSEMDSVLKKKVLLFLGFFQPLTLMILAMLLQKNVILYRTIYLLVPSFIMWLVLTLVPDSPNMIHKVFWGISVVVIAIGLVSWTPLQQGGNLDEFSNFVEKHFEPEDVFYHNNGLSAIVFSYYFPDKPNYLMFAQNMLGEADLCATKIELHRYEPDQVPAQRVWVVWAHHEDLEQINPEADRKTSIMIADCPLVSVLHYPQSWDNEIYLCERKQP